MMDIEVWHPFDVKFYSYVAYTYLTLNASNSINPFPK